jgi:hypothetical protein
MGNKIKRLYLLWLARRLPTCKQILPEISESMDRKLPLRRWIVLKLHLHICEMCLQYEKQLELMRAAMKEKNKTPAGSALSSEAKERMKRAMRL